MQKACRKRAVHSLQAAEEKVVTRADGDNVESSVANSPGVARRDGGVGSLADVEVVGQHAKGDSNAGVYVWRVSEFLTAREVVSRSAEVVLEKSLPC
jgi:hypothetical protein